MRRSVPFRILREIAVLLTALAFLVGVATARQEHAVAVASAGATAGLLVLCHGEPAPDPSPGKLPVCHHCEHCLACHPLLPADVVALARPLRGWQPAPGRLDVASLTGAARAALPFATGPPQEA